MTTKKQPPISKHKHTATRRVVQPAPQAFDIIPRSQVRPSATSRPVIPSKASEVADTTLATPPTVRLSHQTLLATKADVTNVTGLASKPTERGVSVADLIAKKSEPIVITNSDADAEPKLPPLEAPEATTAVQSEEKQEVTPPVTTETEVTAAVSDKNTPEVTTDLEPKLPKLSTPSPKTDEPDSLAQALKADDDQPQEHSEALKDALNDLSGQPAAHHELYGGKPVIVVHKPHGKHSALMWSLWFFFCLGLALLIVNLLLDAGIIETTYNVPYTDFL